MNCLQVEENFSAHYEDTLDYQTLRLFETHIADCTSCQHDYTQFRDAVKASQLLPQIEPSPNFIQNLNIRLEEEQREKISFWEQLRLIFSTPKWAFSAVMILLLITASVTFLFQNDLFNRETHTSIDPGYVPSSETPSQIQLIPRSDFSTLPSTQSMQQHYTLKRVSYSTVSTGGGL